MRKIKDLKGKGLLSFSEKQIWAMRLMNNLPTLRLINSKIERKNLELELEVIGSEQ